MIIEWEKMVQSVNQTMNSINTTFEEMEKLIFIDSDTLCEQDWTISHFIETCKYVIEQNGDRLSKLIAKVENLLRVSTESQSTIF